MTLLPEKLIYTKIFPFYFRWFTDCFPQNLFLDRLKISFPREALCILEKPKSSYLIRSPIIYYRFKKKEGKGKRKLSKSIFFWIHIEFFKYINQGGISDEGKFRHLGKSYPREIGIWEYKIISPSFLGHKFYAFRRTRKSILFQDSRLRSRPLNTYKWMKSKGGKL